MFMSLLTDKLLYLSLTCLIIESKLKLELGLVAKQMNINNFFFPRRARDVYKQFDSFTALNTNI